MTNELEKGKKKVDDLNFKKQKQFSFEDFRDTEILKEDIKNNDLFEETKMEETNDIIEESSEENKVNNIESFEESKNLYNNFDNKVDSSEEDSNNEM